MKTLYSYIILLALMLLIGSCATTESTTNEKEGLNVVKEEKNADVARWELDDFMAKHQDSLQYIISDSTSALHKEWDSLSKAAGLNFRTLTEEEQVEMLGLIDSLFNVDVSPNPTSTFVTLKFFTNLPTNRDHFFPRDLTVDLYYLDQKIHTFDFPNSYGEETIPEQYLQKDGAYRIIYDGNSVPFMVRKN